MPSDFTPPEWLEDEARRQHDREAEARRGWEQDMGRTAPSELDKRRAAAGVAHPAGGLRMREGDQPLPTIDPTGICVQDEVIAFIEARKAVGIARYGTVLQPNNGRDALRDLFEELVDATQYAAQALIERDGHL